MASPTIIQLPFSTFISFSSTRSQKSFRHDAATTKAKKTSAGVTMASAAIAGAVESAVTYPFEFAKTRVQLHTAPTSRKNPFSVIASVARNEGFSALYTGSSCMVLGTAFKTSVRILTFYRLRNYLSDEKGTLSPARGILAGVLAGTAESIIAVTPTERMKTLLIEDARNSKKLYRSEFQAFKFLLRTHGLSSLYHGMVSTTLKQASTSGIKMGFYNVEKEIARRSGLQQSSPLTFAMGALAGTVTVYLTQPFDTIKTRAQSASGSDMREACRRILSEHGVREFWSGSTSRLGRLVVSTGIVYTVFEKTSSLLTMGLNQNKNESN
ncbi:mitochondrial carrier [Paraphaeosphaeria sporulosa]|uniref:Mitochondrial carrier n=1 Tax=Paraphaeosphaeria sporulosa TaxID=1460663 RepID=A0A177CFC9_9PLEO|nr:mitochondrial carrier [Paraphaeosphaeria sporulosa]OAG06315.1 mitochondrial carrier [Paraphaeosphaeria sporulosa]